MQVMEAADPEGVAEVEAGASFGLQNLRQGFGLADAQQSSGIGLEPQATVFIYYSS